MRVAQEVRGLRAADLPPLLVCLRCIRVPADFLTLVHIIMKAPNLSHGCKYDAVEFFAGDMAFTRGHQKRGRLAVPFEIKLAGKLMDINSSHGFAHAVHLMCCVKPGGSCLLAPVCSSWVFMNRGSSGRTFAQPLGNESSELVCAANKMISRVVLILAIGWVLGLLLIWEQPKGSLMQEHPRLQDPGRINLLGFLLFDSRLNFHNHERAF